MKYCGSGSKNIAYMLESMSLPYLIENKLKDILVQISFVKNFNIKIRVDKDGLYDFYKDNVTITITILNPIYTIHLLEEEESITDILRSYIHPHYDLYVDDTYVDE